MSCDHKINSKKQAAVHHMTVTKDVTVETTCVPAQAWLARSQSDLCRQLQLRNDNKFLTTKFPGRQTHLYNALHQIFLRNGIFAADDLLEHARQNQLITQTLHTHGASQLITDTHRHYTLTVLVSSSPTHTDITHSRC